MGGGEDIGGCIHVDGEDEPGSECCDAGNEGEGKGKGRRRCEGGREESFSLSRDHEDYTVAIASTLLSIDTARL